jgi:hypothetical protein
MAAVGANGACAPLLLWREPGCDEEEANLKTPLLLLLLV